MPSYSLTRTLRIIQLNGFTCSTGSSTSPLCQAPFSQPRAVVFILFRELKREVSGGREGARFSQQAPTASALHSS